ncbi:MAG: hypothetical protein II992_07985 [Lachnospiraceae bacterium]|nr:hypothetical protein [Lachnospiraceae bacterium]
MSKYSKEIIIKIREEYLSGNLSEMELCNFYPDVTGEKMSFYRKKDTNKSEQFTIIIINAIMN